MRELREHFPPASAGKDSYTLLKFYNLSTLLVSSVLKVGSSRHPHCAALAKMLRSQSMTWHMYESKAPCESAPEDLYNQISSNGRRVA